MSVINFPVIPGRVEGADPESRAEIEVRYFALTGFTRCARAPE